MNSPGWIELALLALASWRSWVLVSSDTITERLRRYVTERLPVEEFLECPYCSGFWISAAWWGLWQMWPSEVMIAAGGVSVSALVPLIERLSSDE